MSRFNVLLHGDLDRVADVISGDNEPLDLGEIQAALTNVVRRVRRLEEAWEAEHTERPL